MGDRFGERLFHLSLRRCLLLFLFYIYFLFPFQIPNTVNAAMADPKFLQYVDDHKADYIKRLSKAVSIPSYVVCYDKSQVSLVLTSGDQRLGKP